MKKPKKYCCDQHPNRPAIVQRGDKLLCWQCYLSPEEFDRRFGADFYLQEKP